MRATKVFILVCCLCVFSVGALHAEVIDFEPPAYTAGEAPPSPWEYDETRNSIVITDTQVLEGSQSLSVLGTGYSNSGKCTYPISATATGTYTISTKIKTTSYNPANYDSGYVSLGGFVVCNSSGYPEAAIYFEMQKPYAAPIEWNHRQIWMNEAWNTIGYFVNGGIYDISYTWDWDAKTITVRIVGSGGVDITEVYENNRLKDLAEIELLGNHQLVPGATLFDNVSMERIEASIVGDFDGNGVVDALDYARLAVSWLSTAGQANWDAECNLDNTGSSEDVIDFADLKAFCDCWLDGAE